MRFIIISFSTALALSAALALLVFGFGSGARIAASDLQTNVIRVQSLDPDGDALVMLGSSISGRLRPEFFELGDRPARVLGLDGSGPPFGATLLDEFGVTPPVLVVEANSLFVQNPGNEAALLDSVRGESSLFARLVPVGRAEARPSAMLYSLVKSMKDRAAGGPLPRPGALQAEVPTETGAGGHDPVPEVLVESMRRCLKGGGEVILAMVPDDPSGGKPRAREHAAALALAGELGIPYYDLRWQLADLGLVYSDGLHLTAPSAKAVAQALSSILEPSGRR